MQNNCENVCKFVYVIYYYISKFVNSLEYGLQNNLF